MTMPPDQRDTTDSAPPNTVATADSSHEPMGTVPPERCDDLTAWVDCYRRRLEWILLPLRGGKPCVRWAGYRENPTQYVEDSDGWAKDGLWDYANGVGVIPDASRIIVIDIDVNEDDDPFAYLSHKLRALGHDTPVTETDIEYGLVRTRSRRRHVYYRWPEQLPTGISHIPSISRRLADDIGVPLVEVKAQGNHCVPLPPSTTEAGGYEWIRPPYCTGKTGFQSTLSDPPEWFWTLARAALEVDASRHRAHAPQANNPRPAVQANGTTPNPSRMDEGERALRYQQKWAAATDGQRYETLTRLVGALCGKEFGEDAIVQAVRVFAARCDPPYPDEELRRCILPAVPKWVRAEHVPRTPGSTPPPQPDRILSELPDDIVNPPNTVRGDDVAVAAASAQDTLPDERTPSKRDEIAEIRKRVVGKGFGRANPYRPAVLAEELRRLRHWFAVADGQGMPVTLYHYAAGVYRPDGTGVAHALTKQILNDLSTDDRRNRAVAELKLSVVIDAEEQCNTGRLRNDDLPHSWINVRNGLVNWRTGEKASHTPQAMSTIQIPVRYDADAECPAIHAFLEQVLPEDCVDLMYQVIGYLMLPTTDHQKAFMFTGAGANGKSVLLDLLREFLGAENCASVSLQKLAQDRFAASNLVDKLANMQADLDNTGLRSTGVFKLVVSGDMLTAERKGEHAFQFMPSARLIYSANEIPKSMDKTHGYYRRWCIIPFPNRFEGSDRRDKSEMLAEMTTASELSGLLNRAIAGLHELADANGFTEPTSTLQAMESYRSDNEHVRVFFGENCIFDPDLFPDRAAGRENLHPTLGKTEVWKAYQDWCEEAGVKQKQALSRADFNSAMEAMGAKTSKGTPNDHDRHGEELAKKNVWRGVRWRGPDDENLEEDTDLPF